jgi:hypothetical protein
MSVASMILGMLGGLLGIAIEFHLFDALGLQAPAPPTNPQDYAILFACAVASIIGGAMVPSRRAFGNMYVTEIGALIMLTGGTAMGVFLGMASKSSVPVLMTFVGAILGLLAADKYPRPEPVTE